MGSTREDVAGVEVPGPSSASPSPAAPPATCRYCGNPASVYVPQLSKAPLCGLCALVILGDVPARLFLAARETEL